MWPRRKVSRVTFDPQTGVATIFGTYTCTNGDFIDLFVEALQEVGRFAVVGSGGFFDFGTCDGESHTWSAEVFPYNGRFAGGREMTVTFSFSCGLFDCAYGFLEQTVRLRGKPSKGHGAPGRMRSGRSA